MAVDPRYRLPVAEDPESNETAQPVAAATDDAVVVPEGDSAEVPSEEPMIPVAASRSRPDRCCFRSWSRGGMGVAITLCYETKHERREDKDDYSLFRRGEADSLSRLIEF